MTPATTMPFRVHRLIAALTTWALPAVFLLIVVGAGVLLWQGLPLVTGLLTRS